MINIDAIREDAHHAGLVLHEKSYRLGVEIYILPEYQCKSYESLMSLSETLTKQGEMIRV